MKNRLILLIFCLGIVLHTNATNVKHVVLIGCDGFGAYAYNKANMPNLKKLAADGSWSLKARSVLPSSSAVNWASMLMSASPTLHGYTEWGSQTPEIPSAATSQYGKFPSIYTIIKEQLPQAKTAVVYSWGGIEYLVEKEIIDFVIPTNDNDNLCVDEAVTIIKNEKPLFTFIHLDEPDHIGHSAGHNTPEYYAELENVDARIGRIVQAVKDAGIENETIIMVVSDHGGIEKGHGGKTLYEVEVPIVMCGPGIKKGHEIKDVIIDYDYGATIAEIFGLKRPQAWRGIPISDAFIK
ncbi:alkaline phosphatase [Dysgonomonas sp. ZJ279]|uniref:alkaline phosphatase n=1 Tax=Dysgonomonas sp. ZJ279 TaxID=2709796 RepID=UPI0013ED3CCC|nr:alkaline phosphatase [Dysgonomonas sp. ZJ279]